VPAFGWFADFSFLKTGVSWVDAKSHNLVLARELLLTEGRTSEHQVKVSKIFELLWEPVCRYLILSSVSRAVAEDLAQEAFLRLYSSMEKGQPVENVNAWVFRVARNLAVDYLRKKDPLNSAGTEPVESIASGMADPAPDAEKMVLLGEDRQRFEASLRTLSHQEQQCVFLRLEGLRYAEIAEVLSISVGNVSTYLSRGIKKLRKRS
jgi:RNA polymerase sigma-70 factor (ECF subfamily)